MCFGVSTETNQWLVTELYLAMMIGRTFGLKSVSPRISHAGTGCHSDHVVWSASRGYAISIST